MGKIVIMEEKADRFVDKLETMKETIGELIDCFSESMEGHRYPDEDEWNDEYEVKRRRGGRPGYNQGMRRGMRGTGEYSRY